VADCKFCAFYRRPKHAEGYVLSFEEIGAKIDECLALGGVQILLQGGHNPYIPFEWYLDLMRYIKRNHPIHIHGVHFVESGTDGGPTNASAQVRETTVNVPPGATRDIEFVADAPGDWAMHCHKTHHTMNQMAHDVPNLTGVDQKGVEEKVQGLLPGYMAMGQTGTGDMMEMGRPRNTLSMMTGHGQFGSIDMGGMFTVVKVREGITSYADPGPYKNPPGTVAHKVADESGKDEKPKSGDQGMHHHEGTD